ncbi:MAG: LamG domain-containing protein [Pirellulales bacterium]|nr:LamG domain-containing protein [Pirellulales bacterium]
MAWLTLFAVPLFFASSFVFRVPLADAPAKESGDQDPVTEEQVRDLLSDAHAIFNFEPGTYALAGELNYVLHRDLGPGDEYGRFEGFVEFADGVAGQAYVLGKMPRAMRSPQLRHRISDQMRQVTVSFWHKAAAKRKAFLFCCGISPKRSVSILALANGRMEIGCGGTVLTTKKDAYSPEWQHVALVFNYTQLHLYLDGTLFESWQLVPTILDIKTIGSASTYFGAKSIFDKHRPTLLYDGLMDEFAILPSAASPEQIQLLYNWGKAGKPLPEIEDDPQRFQGVAHGVPDMQAPRVSFSEEFALEQDVRYPAVFKILDSALSVFNFEPGTYSRDRSILRMMIQDLGPADNFAECVVGSHFVQGVAGQGFGFDGTTRSLRLPTLHRQLTAGQKAFTLSFWQRAGSKKNGVIFDCGTYPGKSLAVVVRGDMRYQIHCGKGVTLTSSREFWTDQWQHFAFVFDETLVKMYVDGRLRETWLIAATSLDAGVIGGDSVRFGIQAKTDSPDRPSRFYHGLLDEIVILPRAAADDEIALLYEWTRDGLPLPMIPDDPSLVTTPARGSPWEIPLAKTPGLPPDTSAAEFTAQEEEEAKNDPRRPAVTELVSDALAMFTFEPDARRGYADLGQTHIQDAGEVDNWGNVTGKVEFSEGVAGDAILFDGKTTVMTMPTLPQKIVDGRKQLTVALWHKTTSQEWRRMLFNVGSGNRDGISIRQNPDQRYFINAGRENWLITKDPLWTKEWRHVVTVFDHTRVDLYLDGQLTESWEIPPTAFNKKSIPGRGMTTTIGRSGLNRKGDKEQQHFSGLIDEVAILPKALSAEEAQLLYEWGRDGRTLPVIPDIPALLNGPPHGVRQSP